MTTVRYRGAALDPIVRVYAATFGSVFVLMDDNDRPHSAGLFNLYHTLLAE